MKQKFIALIMVLTLCLSLLVLLPTGVSAEASSLPVGESASMDCPPFEFVPYTVMKVGESTALQNDKFIKIDKTKSTVTPIKKSGRTLVPLRFCGDSLGGKTKYISDKDFITVTVGENIAKFKINAKQLQIVGKNGKILRKITLDVAPIKRNGRVMVPVRAISEGLKATVFYQKTEVGEMVLVSAKPLSKRNRGLFIATLSNRWSYTLTHPTGGFTTKVPGSWVYVGGEKPDGGWSMHELQSPLFPNLDMCISHLSLSEAKKVVYASAKDIKKMYGSSLSLESFERKKINGMDAVSYSFVSNYPNPIQTWRYIVIVSPSAKLGVEYHFLYNGKISSEQQSDLLKMANSTRMPK